MAKKQTPLMRQYLQIKNKYPDTILLFRLGDFFETFDEDAGITAQVCGITLTKRNNGSAEAIPLAGFPHHQLDNYLPKLVRAGYRVAVCEQMEDPRQARGIVRRDVVEVVTPGVAFNEKLLDTKRNNYLAALALQRGKFGRVAGLACVDISTGEFFTAEVAEADIVNLLETLQPSEILLNKRQREDIEAICARLAAKPVLTRLEEWIFDEEFARRQLTTHLKTVTLKGFGIEDNVNGIIAAGAALHYISETQKGSLPHIRAISLFNPGDYMALDFATRRNLEITFSMSDASRDGTLISILDQTLTAMGGRLLKKWITRPLRKPAALEKRHEAVLALFEDSPRRDMLREELRQVGDIERLMSRICTGRATPRDLASLKSTLQRIPRIKKILLEAPSDTLQKLGDALKPMDNIVAELHEALVDEPPAQTGGGNVFREGYSAELDEYREAMYSGKSWIQSYQESERQASGIPSLKVGFNNVFGYYLDITNAHRNKVPEHYERRQTLANSERYITPALKEIEEKILNAEEKLADLERELFAELRAKVADSAELAQANAGYLAMADCLQSYADIARRYDFTRPELNEGEELYIEDGRHPVVERLLPVGERYVPNTSSLGTEGEQVHIITGPNMSGKSSYLRQVGLIVLLAQIGSFVPARRARIGLVDTIFTRVGAQDNITAGESTFLVEMQEAANILNNATRRSLILLDEVGRGTATFDGISIAWAIAEYIHENIGAKTLFATHYHELNDLAERFERIHNYKVEVQELAGKVLFTHRVVPGASDHSFGIHVAEMAGLPTQVTERARLILKHLESSGLAEIEDVPVAGAGGDVRPAGLPQGTRAATAAITAPAAQEQLSLFEIRDDRIREKLREININEITPLQALQALQDLQKMLRR